MVMKKVSVKVYVLTLVSLFLLSCGKSGNGSDSISDDGIFGSAGAEFVEIFLNEPNREEISDAIAKEVEGEMMRKYPDYEDMNFRARPEIQIELNQKYEDAVKKYDYQGLKDKWDQRIAELVEELSTIEIPVKVEEGTPLKLLSPIKLKDFDKTIKNNTMFFGFMAELTEDFLSPTNSYPKLKFMDADGNAIGSRVVWDNKMNKPKDGLKKGSQMEMVTSYEYPFNKESIQEFFSTKYVLLTWNTFYVEDGKLGPIQVGMSYTDLPKSVPCLYDKFEYKKEMIENEMEGNYEVETCYFFNDGKECFSAELENGKVTSIVLDKNSPDISTIEGYKYGNGVLSLYESWSPNSYGSINRKIIRESLNWENYYEGEVFVTIGRYTFYVPSDMAKTEFPKTSKDFKDGAKCSRIVCK